MKRRIPMVCALSAGVFLCARWTFASTSVAPPWSGGSTQVSLQGNDAVLRYTNGSNYVQYVWRCPTNLATGTTMTSIFGSLTFETNMGGQDQVTPVGNTGYIKWSQSMTYSTTTLQLNSQTAICDLFFTGVGQAVTLELQASLDGPTLQFDAAVLDTSPPHIEVTVAPQTNSATIQATSDKFIDLQVSYSSGIENNQLLAPVLSTTSQNFGTYFSTAIAATVPNLSAGTSYYFQVTAYDDAGNSTQTVIMSFFTAGSPASSISDFSSLKIYPNPWRSDKHSGYPVTFSGLPSGSTVKLFTVSGHWIKTLPVGSGSIPWDLTNDSGDKVASGIYWYLITDDQGQKTHGEVAIIK